MHRALEIEVSHRFVRFRANRREQTLFTRDTTREPAIFSRVNHHDPRETVETHARYRRYFQSFEKKKTTKRQTSCSEQRLRETGTFRQFSPRAIGVPPVISSALFFRVTLPPETKFLSRRSRNIEVAGNECFRVSRFQLSRMFFSQCVHLTLPDLRRADDTDSNSHARTYDPTTYFYASMTRPFNAVGQIPLIKSSAERKAHGRRVASGL